MIQASYICSKLGGSYIESGEAENEKAQHICALIIFSDLLFHFGNFFVGEKYAMRTIPVLAVNKSEGLKVEVRTSSGPQLKYNREHFAILYTLEM